MRLLPPLRRLRRALPLALAPVTLAAAIALPAQRPAPDPARVDLPLGTLQGARDTAAGVLVFRGVPYAAAPVGPLRFRPPQPPRRWPDTRDAGRLAHNCMQGQPYGDIDPYAAGVSEDCLYLNVWTNGTGGPPRPVLVWIHGGGFTAGFGGEARHDATRLAQKGAVVVTLNYRLGPFGFLAHPALAAEPGNTAGNYGLQDQIAALRWVRRYIGAFGGDTGRVTIFGESAGGMSVGALVASPLAKGLFARAIMESGSGIGTGAVPRDSALAAGARFAESLGINGAGGDAASRLRAVPADSLLAAGIAAGRATPGAIRFSPDVDGRVLPRPVDSALTLGTASAVPVILGSNADEPGAPFGAPARSFARLVARRGGRAYLYQFTRAAEEDSAARARGAYHSAEITFVFGRARPLNGAGQAAYDSTLAERMSDYWVAFAATGDPNGPLPRQARADLRAAAAGRPRWPVYDPRTDRSLELGATIAVRAGVRRAAFDSLDAAGRARGEVRP